MPETEVHIIDTVSKLDARPEDTSYAFRQENEDQKNRINILFDKEDEPEEKKDDNFAEGEDQENNFDSVNEGMTSDTTEAPTSNFKRTKLEAEDSKSQQTASASGS